MHQKIFSAIEKLIYSGMLANPITLKNYFENEKDDINVPDYGLDTPGAVLETLHEQKELLQPNMAGMALAVVGADLLEEDESSREKKQNLPDTTGINLVTSFDVST